MSDPLCIEGLRKRFRYEPETGNIYVRYSTRAGFDISKPVGFRHTIQGYLRVQVDSKTIASHRLAWALYYGEWPAIVDHIDRDRTNNRITNLRLATVFQNNCNQGAHSKLGVKGVMPSQSRKKYIAQIGMDGTTKHLGTFSTIDEAAHAYNKAAIKHFGDFAVLNPIGADK